MAKIDGGLRKEFQKHLPRSRGFQWTVVETGGTHNGVPDTYWAHESGVQGWVECKKTDGWAVDVRPHQVGWLVSHARLGVPVTVAVRASGVGSSEGRGDSLWLVHGSAAELLQDVGLRLDRPAVLGRWLGPPRSWDWNEIGRLLLLK